MVKKDDPKFFMKQANLIISDKKNSNLILELILKLEDENLRTVLWSSNALFKVFSHFIKLNVIDCSPSSSSSSSSSSSITKDASTVDAIEKYKQWMNERFQTSCELWCIYFAHEYAVVREKSLCVMMDLLKVFASTSMSQSRNLYDYPFKFIQKILYGLTSLKFHEDSGKGNKKYSHNKCNEADNNNSNNNNNNSNNNDNNTTTNSNNENFKLNDTATDVIIKRLLMLIDNFKQYTMFDDLRYFIMKVLYEDIYSKIKIEPLNLDLLFCMLKNLNMPKSSSSSSSSSSASNNAEGHNLKNLFVHSDQSIQNITQAPKYTLLKEHKKIFSNLWIDFLKMDLPKTLYKSVLVVLHDCVMPYMSSPLHLSDFLTFTYNAGGNTSLLALNGLFVLMNSYNLDYPDFYGKLYSLLEPSIFYVQYRPRFMYLLDVFLSSTHLSANLVAAFIKKLSRLSLSAPTSCLPCIITLIMNLLIRHPNCQSLVHKSSHTHDGDDIITEMDNTEDDKNDNVIGDENIMHDPFDDNETNPLKTKAMQSSLWELKALQHHYHHSISSKANRIDHLLPKIELPYKDHLETTITDLIDKEKHKKMKTVATNYIPPKSFIPDSLTDLLSFS